MYYDISIQQYFQLSSQSSLFRFVDKTSCILGVNYFFWEHAIGIFNADCSSDLVRDNINIELIYMRN